MVRVAIMCDTHACVWSKRIINTVQEPMTLDEAEAFIDYWPYNSVPQDYCPKCGRIGTPGITDYEEEERQ